VEPAPTRRDSRAPGAGSHPKTRSNGGEDHSSRSRKGTRHPHE
jgi:hypothetical protein